MRNDVASRNDTAPPSNTVRAVTFSAARTACFVLDDAPTGSRALRRITAADGPVDTDPSRLVLSLLRLCVQPHLTAKEGRGTPFMR